MKILDPLEAFVLKQKALGFLLDTAIVLIFLDGIKSVLTHAVIQGIFFVHWRL